MIRIAWIQGSLVVLTALLASAHGTLVAPLSRVYRVYTSNPQNPGFPLGQSAVAIDGTLSYDTWNKVSRNVPEAVQAGLPPGFDYSPWFPDGALASAGRTDPNSTVYPRTYAGLDRVSGDWPRTPVVAGATLPVDFLVTAPHSPSVWDVWMTTPDWTPASPLTGARWSSWVARRSVGSGGTTCSTCRSPPTAAVPMSCGSRGNATTRRARSSSRRPTSSSRTRASAPPIAVRPSRIRPGYRRASWRPAPRRSSTTTSRSPRRTCRTRALSPPVAAAPGESWNFQAWYRDANPGATSNFNDALAVTWN